MWQLVFQRKKNTNKKVQTLIMDTTEGTTADGSAGSITENNPEEQSEQKPDPDPAVPGTVPAGSSTCTE